MLFLIVFIFCLCVAIAVGVMAAMSDFRGLRIPNAYSLVIAAVFFLGWLAARLGGAEGVFQPLQSHLYAGGGVFILTLVLFFLKVFGGGDAKLLSAYALWAGLMNIITLLFYMALAGCVLAVAALIIRKLKPFKAPPEGSWIAQLQAGKAVVPYGIPIVIGAFAAFGHADFMNMASFAKFMN